ncbi:MAG: FAD-dependent oxidoreductase [Desulfobulbus sp.]|jgi:nitrite reductase (NADH) large subunit|nr:FAD-dependent oxidoreductase [Desulfobulbus sp.]
MISTKGEQIMKRYVIIGNGAAANSAAETIRKHDQTGSIVLFSREPHEFYYTPALPELISGEKNVQGLTIHGSQWYAQREIDVRLGCPVRAIDSGRRTISPAQGDSVSYDALLLATGGKAFVPSIPGADFPGVFTMRTLDDAVRIRQAMSTGRRVALIGGGLLGLEAGNGLSKAGARVEVVEVFPRLLPRQTDPEGARMLQNMLEKMGFGFHLGGKTRKIVKAGRVLEVHLENGTVLEAEAVLLSAGVRPELELASQLGLAVDKAVKVDDRMQTSLPGVYAAGDVCEHRGRYYGIWPAAVEQGRVAGSNMAGRPMEYGGTVRANSLKVAGIDLTAFGEIDTDGLHTAHILIDSEKSIYRKLVHDQNQILGGIFLGDPQGAAAAMKAMKSGKPPGPELMALFPEH